MSKNNYTITKALALYKAMMESEGDCTVDYFIDNQGLVVLVAATRGSELTQEIAHRMSSTSV